MIEMAKNDLVKWLSHPSELAKPPFKIEFVKVINYEGLDYYLFKYKSNIISKWLLGISGGYEKDGLEPNGFTFSEMEEFNEEKCDEDAIKLIEKVKEYYLDSGEKGFISFVLLNSLEFNKKEIIKRLTLDWNLEILEGEESDEAIVFSINDTMLSIGFMPGPIPNEEACEAAKNNYLWQDAYDVTKTHVAHILVAIMGDNLKENGKYLVMLSSSLAKLDNAIGIYTAGTVFEPKFYTEFSEMLKEDYYPIFNLVWFGLYKSENGFNCYTYGLSKFEKYEIEVLNVQDDPWKLKEFVADIVNYYLTYDVTLKDGETIGFSEDDKHSITISKGVSLPFCTIKVEY